MNVLQVNYTDLPGKRFNGYDLNIALRRDGIDAKQIVLNKYTDIEEHTVSSLKQDLVLHELYRWVEDKYSVSNVLYPYGKQFMESADFKGADIIHYHILHRFMFSLFDYPELMNGRNVVWTIHDPWIITGNCVYPLNCKNWKTGCIECKRLKENGFEMRYNHTSEMWKIKETVLKQINPHIIVSSHFMEQYIEKSPITKHFNKIHKIPFGINVEDFQLEHRSLKRKQHKIEKDEIVIGFRSDANPVKGCSYIYEALRNLDDKEKIVLATVGTENIPSDIEKKYKVQNFGWINGKEQISNYLLICDIFLMPSLAESFGLMAIEAMAAETPVVCFKGTTVEGIIGGTMCGLPVDYRSSEALAKAIYFLSTNQKVRIKMGKEGRKRVCKHYLFEDYVYRHKKLYYEILSNQI